MAEKAFNIAISEQSLHLLLQKLAIVVSPDELEDSGKKYGTALADIQRLTAFWSNGFDWRKAEAQINSEMPQFTRNIDIEGHGSFNVHYVHKKSDLADAIPLLFVHGWPGSFLEVRKLLPLLTSSSPEYPSFHVVALSLPGFGFSEGPKKQGFRIAQYAETAHKLMLALGYEHYVAQGGDWGYVITRELAKTYGEKHVKAWHTNSPIPRLPHPIWEPFAFLSWCLTPYTKAEKAGLERTAWFESQGVGYFMQQTTQPQTLGYALADSPVALLAWIYEKLVNWADEYPWTDEEVLELVSVYWFSTAGPAASLRIYFEAIQGGDSFRPTGQKPGIPLGISHFPKDLVILPRKWMSTIGNIVLRSEHTSGGHFAALEKPEALATDLRNIFKIGGPAFGAVPGKTGYM
ncbi:Alpha/Beta hydrolase protein [Mycena floridula]|nr:Alpha/Beta hydrolase protein [Mycena floridula]